jgi:putative FmdB family regulatory protein
MPIYEYACEKCEHEFEREQRITDDPVKTCPQCRSRKVKKLISRTSFVLKGGGWYADAYSSTKKDSPSDSNESSSSDSSESGSSDSSESGSPSKDSSSKDSSESKSKPKTKSDSKPKAKSGSKKNAA